MGGSGFSTVLNSLWYRDWFAFERSWRGNGSGHPARTGGTFQMIALALAATCWCTEVVQDTLPVVRWPIIDHSVEARSGLCRRVGQLDNPMGASRAGWVPDTPLNASADSSIFHVGVHVCTQSGESVPVFTRASIQVLPGGRNQHAPRPMPSKRRSPTKLGERFGGARTNANTGVLGVRTADVQGATPARRGTIWSGASPAGVSPRSRILQVLPCQAVKAEV